MKTEDKHLVRMEGRCRGLLEAAPDAMVVVNQDEEIVLVNARAEKQFGYSREELLGRPVTILIPEGLAARLPADGLRTPAQQIGVGIELTGRRKNGSAFPIEIMLSPNESDEGTLVTAAIRDITTRKTSEAHLLKSVAQGRVVEEALFDEKERAQVTLNCIGDGVVCTDISGNVTFLNVVAEKLTGWVWQEAAGRPMAEVFPILNEASRETVPNPMEIAVDRDRTVHLPSNCLLVRRDGSEIPIEDSVAPIHDREGRATGAVIVFRDVSAARVMALKLAHSAQHDFLTGLPNRMLLNDRVSQAISLAPRHRKNVAILYLDLDGFKHINDSLGTPSATRCFRSSRNAWSVACVARTRSAGREAMNLSCCFPRWNAPRMPPEWPGGCCRRWSRCAPSSSSPFTSPRASA